MMVGLITVALSLLLNGVALVVSLRFDRRGLPASMNGQVTPRKLHTLPPRLRLIGFNLACQYVAAVVLMAAFGEYIPIAWPGVGLFLGQLALVCVADDLSFYWFHRVLHRNRWLYRKIHKRHHEAYAPVPIEYVYVHPAEWLGGTVGLTVALLGIVQVWGSVSAWVVWAYIALRTLHELDIHSGLRLATRHIPLIAPMRHHDLHHARPTRGNYASFLTLWDRLLGTRIDEAPAP